MHQRAGGMAGAGMHHQSRRLVDDDQVGVVVEDGQRQIFGDERGGCRVGHVQRDPVALSHLRTGLGHWHPRHSNPTLVDEALELGARGVGHLAGKELVETQAVLVGRDLEGKLVHAGRLTRTPGAS